MKMFWMAILIWIFSGIHAQDHALIAKVKSISDLVALWDFKEPTGEVRSSLSDQLFSLTEINGIVPRVPDGPLLGFSSQFGQGPSLSLANAQTGKLNIHGTGRGVTAVAWIKWTGEQTGFVGGMWNEYQDGGKRQYGLFVSLPYSIPMEKMKYADIFRLRVKQLLHFDIQLTILRAHRKCRPVNGFALRSPMTAPTSGPI